MANLITGDRVVYYPPPFREAVHQTAIIQKICDRRVCVVFVDGRKAYVAPNNLVAQSDMFEFAGVGDD